MLVFSTPLVNCFPSNLLTDSPTRNPLLPCVNKYGYVFIQCVTGGGGAEGIRGLRQINTCRQVPYWSIRKKSREFISVFRRQIHLSRDDDVKYLVP